MRSVIAALMLAALLPLPASAADEFAVEIVRPAPLSKDALFTQTLLWMAESFRSSKEVIDLKDKELGTIIGNGAFDMNIGLVPFLPPVNVPVTFKVRIDVKDNRYRMAFSQVKIAFDGRPNPIEETNRESNEPRVRERFEQMANSLDAYLSRPRKDF